MSSSSHVSPWLNVFILVLLFSILTPAASAQPPGESNGAEAYQRAFELLNRLSREDRNTIINSNYSADRITPEVRGALERARPFLDALRAGASHSHVDFGLRYEDGVAMELAHLRPLREGVHLLMADARARLDAGDVRAAAANLSSALRISHHATTDGVLISSLVGAAAFTITSNNVYQMLGEGALDQAAAHALLDTLNATVRSDPFGIADALNGEREIFGQWLMQEYGPDGDGARMLDELGDFMGDPGDLDLSLQVALLDPDGFRGEMARYDEALARMVEIARMDDLSLVSGEMSELMARIENGEYGPIARMFVPGVDQAMSVVLMHYNVMAQLHEDLETASKSPEGLRSLENAAVWYQRAHTILIETMAERAQRLEAAVEQPEFVTDNEQVELDELFASLDSMREYLARAARIDRCDFDPAGLHSARGPRDVLAPLHDMRVLHAAMILDTERLARVGDVIAVGAHSARLVRLSEHLGQAIDRHSVLAAHELFLRLAPMIERVRKHLPLTIEMTAPAQTSLDRLSNDDPFGFNRAISAWPQRVTTWARKRYVGTPGHQRFTRELAWLDRDAGDEPPLDMAVITPEHLQQALVELDDAAKELVILARTVETADLRAAVEVRLEPFNERHLSRLARALLGPIASLAERRDEARLDRETFKRLLEITP